MTASSATHSSTRRSTTMMKIATPASRPKRRVPPAARDATQAGIGTRATSVRNARPGFIKKIEHNRSVRNARPGSMPPSPCVTAEHASPASAACLRRSPATAPACRRPVATACPGATRRLKGRMLRSAQHAPTAPGRTPWEHNGCRSAHPAAWAGTETSPSGEPLRPSRAPRARQDGTANGLAVRGAPGRAWPVRKVLLKRTREPCFVWCVGRGDLAMCRSSPSVSAAPRGGFGTTKVLPASSAHRATRKQVWGMPFACAACQDNTNLCGATRCVLTARSIRTALRATPLPAHFVRVGNSPRREEAPRAANAARAGLAGRDSNSSYVAKIAPLGGSRMRQGTLGAECAGSVKPVCAEPRRAIYATVDATGPGKANARRARTLPTPKAQAAPAAARPARAGRCFETSTYRVSSATVDVTGPSGGAAKPAPTGGLPTNAPP